MGMLCVNKQQVSYGMRAEHLAALNTLLKPVLVQPWLQKGLEAKGAGLEAKPHFTLQV